MVLKMGSVGIAWVFIEKESNPCGTGDMDSKNVWRKPKVVLFNPRFNGFDNLMPRCFCLDIEPEVVGADGVGAILDLEFCFNFLVGEACDALETDIISVFVGYFDGMVGVLNQVLDNEGCFSCNMASLVGDGCCGGGPELDADSVLLGFDAFFGVHVVVSEVGDVIGLFVVVLVGFEGCDGDGKLHGGWMFWLEICVD